MRLVFNDCSGPKSINGTVDNMVSICDGCIDDKNPINTGLYQHVIAPLIDMMERMIKLRVELIIGSLQQQSLSTMLQN